MERFKDYAIVHGVGMAWFKEQKNGKVQGIHMMADSQSKDGRFQAKQIAMSEKFRWQGSRNADGQEYRW